MQMQMQMEMTLKCTRNEVEIGVKSYGGAQEKKFWTVCDVSFVWSITINHFFYFIKIKYTHIYIYII